jgi:N-acetylneuraminate synthase
MTSSTFIIAEIGINHNGDMKIVRQLIEESYKAGADAVKFQKRDISLVYSKEELAKYRESPWGTTNYEQKKGLELTLENYKEIDEYCKSLKIEWLASAWDLNSLNFLKPFDLKYNKIASAMITDNKLLAEVAKEKKYTFISTGMSSYKEIDNAVEIFNKFDCPFELMHCVSKYPFEAEHASLNLIDELRKRYKCKIGYSGHEKSGVAISFAAVALGATSIERHITLDRTMYGSDQAASLSISGFVGLVHGIRNIEKALKGNDKKEILEIESDVAKKLRAHIKND